MRCMHLEKSGVHLTKLTLKFWDSGVQILDPTNTVSVAVDQHTDGPEDLSSPFILTGRMAGVVSIQQQFTLGLRELLLLWSFCCCF